MVTKTTELSSDSAITNPNQYDTPVGPSREDFEAQQRKQERHEQFEAERAMQRARREAEEANRPEQGPTRKDYEDALASEKKRKFDEEQEEWSRRHEAEVKDREYREEQAKEVAKKKLKPFGEVAKEKAVNTIEGAASQGWANLKKNLSAPVKRADEIREGNANKSGNLTKADVAKMIRAGKQKQTRGQFNAPRYNPFGGGGKVSGSFPDIDPFGGMGGRGTHMLDIGMGGMGQRPQQQQQPRNAPPKPKPQPMRFPDPFAGIKKGAGKADQNLKVTGKGLGIGKGSGKKLKNMKDWFDF